MFSDLPPTSPVHVAVLIPLRDDWVPASELMRLLDKALINDPCTVDVLLVDDGSVRDASSATFDVQYAQLKSIRVLRLRRNLGHQRAIAIGIVHIERSMPCDAVLVMDGDGEDTPEGVIQLLRAFTGENAVFAERSRRTESPVFKVFYRIYRFLHRVLTGHSVRVGNFSILPVRYLRTLVVMSELWNHYAAAVFRSGLPLSTTPIPRGHRIAGESRMNFVSLTTHGMSAISVYGDIVGVRVLMASMAGALLAILGIIAVIGIRLLTNLAVPGWASFLVGTLIVIIIQLITIATSFTFTMLSNRINLGFVPLRDYELFVDYFRDIYRHD